MVTGKTRKLKDGEACVVVAGTHKGKSGIARDLNISKSGQLTLTVVRSNGERFKTLGRHVQLKQQRTDRNDHAVEKGNKSKPVKLLSGGNPQIALGHGDETVQTYIAAMPGWKRAVGELLDRLITRAVPKVTKAVKWNTPLYGLDKATRFMGFNCTTNYVKVAFFMGAHLDPMPPDMSTRKDVRYLHIRENDKLDEKQFTRWVKEATKLPGVKM